MRCSLPILLLVLGLLGVGGLQAQQLKLLKPETPTATLPAAPPLSPSTDPEWEAMIAALQRDPLNFDYTAWRRSAMNRAGQPTEGQINALRVEAMVALREKRYGDANALALDLVQRAPTCADGHMLLRSVYTAAGETTEAEFHARVAKGLIASIQAGADGRSEDRAWRLFAAHEKYLLLRLMGLLALRSEFSKREGVIVERVQVASTKGRETELFFALVYLDASQWEQRHEPELPEDDPDDVLE